MKRCLPLAVDLFSHFVAADAGQRHSSSVEEEEERIIIRIPVIIP